MNLLEVNKVAVRRGKKETLAPTSFTLTDTSGIVGLFGQNGAGKTTLLKSIAGLLKTHQGTISIAESMQPVFLPDKPYLYEFLKVSECIGVLQQYFADFSAHKAAEILGELNLNPDLKISQLSKGMTEQLSLSMMLARQSSIYLFDEPLAAVDPLTRDTILDLIQRHIPQGSTAVISTHLISGLESIFNECLVLHEGRLILHDKIDKIQNSGGLEESFKQVIRNA